MDLAPGGPDDIMSDLPPLTIHKSFMLPLPAISISEYD